MLWLLPGRFQEVQEQIHAGGKEGSAEIDPDEIKVLVVKGYSIENAIAEFTRAPVQEEEISSIDPVAAPLDPDTAVLRMHIQQLSEQVKTLRSYVDELRREMAGKDAALQKTIRVLDRLKDKTSREIKRDHEIRIRDKEIGRLRSILRSERKYAKKLKRTVAARKKAERIEEVKGLRRLKPVAAFSKEAVILATERLALGEGDLVLLEDSTGGGKSTAELFREREVAGGGSRGRDGPGDEGVFSGYRTASILAL